VRDEPTRFVYLAVLAYVAATALSTLFSASFDASLWGAVPGEEGYALITMSALFVIFGAVAAHLKTEQQMWRLMYAVIAAGALVSGYGVLQNYGADPFDLQQPPGADRISSTMGNPVFAGTMMLIPIPITLAVALRALTGQIRSVAFWRGMAVWVAILTVQVLGLVFTLSRGPWIGALCGLTVFALLGIVIAGRHTFLRTALVLLAAAVATTAVVTVPALVNGLGRSGPEERGGDQGGTAPVVIERLAATQIVGARGLSGRMTVWRDSSRLLADRSWAAPGDSVPAAVRHIVGYGPELFRYAYLQEDTFVGRALGSGELRHAHNFLLHEWIELGALGLLSSAALLGAPLLAGLYLLWTRRRDYSQAHILVLVGLVSALAGRSLEQMAGIGRTGDLILFWVLLAAFVALPTAFGVHDPAQKKRGDSRGRARRPRAASLWERLPWRAATAGVAVALVLVLVWTRGVGHFRAATLAADGAEQSRAAQLQDALASLSSGIDLAPDASIFHRYRAATYSAYRSLEDIAPETGCSQQTEVTYEVCLARAEYLSNQQAALQRPADFRNRLALARSAVVLTLDEQAAQLMREVLAMAPASWRLLMVTADAYVQREEYDAALVILDQIESVPDDPADVAAVFVLRGRAYVGVGQFDRALEDFETAISNDGDASAGYLNRGRAYVALRRYEEAIVDFGSAIEQAPEDPLPYVDRALARVLSGDEDGATRDISRAIQLGFDEGTLQQLLDGVGVRP
jgi:tetratricopeptide (TPR) repeat protein/O-antigen ligase